MMQIMSVEITWDVSGSPWLQHAQCRHFRGCSIPFGLDRKVLCILKVLALSKHPGIRLEDQK